MTRLAEMGAIIAPPVPAFYNQPQTLDGRGSIIPSAAVLDLFDLDTGKVKRWELTLPPKTRCPRVRAGSRRR